MKPLHIKLGDKFPQRLKDEAASLERLERLGIHVFEEIAIEMEISTAPIPARVQKNEESGDKNIEPVDTTRPTLLQENSTMSNANSTTEATNSTTAFVPPTAFRAEEQRTMNSFDVVSNDIHRLDTTILSQTRALDEANMLKSREMNNAASDLVVDGSVTAVAGIAGAVVGFFKGGRTGISTVIGSIAGMFLSQPVSTGIKAIIRGRRNSK